MKKILVIALSSFFSAGAFAAACTADATTSVDPNAAAPWTQVGAVPPATGEECVCDGGTAGKVQVHGGSGEVVGTPIFVNTGFDVQCSANTIVSFDEVSGNEFVVASGSRRGNQSYAGSSNGGAVTTSAKCTDTNDACQAGDVTTALVAARSVP